MSIQAQALDRIPGVTGYLVLNEDGAVALSSGELRNMESLSEPVITLLKAIQKGRQVICKDQEFQNVQIQSGDSLYVVFRQQQKICLLKKRLDDAASA